MKVDVRSPNGKHSLGTTSPKGAVDLMQQWLKESGLWKE